MSGLEPMAVIAIVSAVGGTALSASSQIMQGREQARGAEFEAEQLRIQEQVTKTAAMQEEAKRRDELTSSLETIQAIRAGRGVGAASPTGMATLTSITEDAERDIATSKFNYAQRADIAGRTARMAGNRGRMSLLAGYLGAGATVADAGFRYATAGRRAPPAAT